MDNFIILIFTLIALIFFGYFGYQLDRKGTSHPKVTLKYQIAKLFIFSNKKDRTYFSLAAILIEVISALFAVVSVVLYILTLILKNNDFDFAFSIYTFAICAAVSILYIVQMIVFFIKAIKRD